MKFSPFFLDVCERCPNVFALNNENYSARMNENHPGNDSLGKLWQAFQAAAELKVEAARQVIKMPSGTASAPSKRDAH
jgi:hypothetical protein